MSAPSFHRLVTLCKRYGPGRLPLASRRDIGGGYAMTTAGVLAAIAFLSLTTVPALYFGGGYAMDQLSIYVVYIPPFVLASFPIGVLTWRFLPVDTPQFGAVAGSLTALLSYPAGGVGVALYFVTAEFVEFGSLSTGDITGLFVVGLYAAVVALLTSGLVVVPLGALSGYVHERSRSASVGTA
ncbi:hypothetical protein NDI56_15500 [Haloarcula sp. S1CR25-12]|uniref:Uncharacterized protein n=1 Tax=Haloarcula saliterrae TaxID=2950534 RepID=A0ABU2FGE1_9EURY|nr:hypothetical protein [Haloarcula sp. S1CR25-12]MDS0260811.1 hypothetical protein [Haloarcula sp. S1CR25-12]